LEHPDPGLEQPCFDVDPHDGATIEVAAALVGTMRSTQGCWSLSAPQLGYPMRLLCFDVTGHEEAHSVMGLVVLANPRLLSLSGNVEMREQCISFPRVLVEVARASHVVVVGTVPGSGREVVVVADAFEARRILHELDHLDGITMLDRIQR
jgi:peptide deformylase